jgi:hypothetical protein
MRVRIRIRICPTLNMFQLFRSQNFFAQLLYELKSLFMNLKIRYTGRFNIFVCTK